MTSKENSEQIHVWLVDDDTSLTQLLSEYLSKQSLTCEVFASGEEVLAALPVQTEPDIMVLDIMMPGLSGLQLLPRLRSISQMPVIMLTGRGDDIDRILGLELGADDYLAKPCNPRELLARIQAVVRRHQFIPSAAPSTPSQLEHQGIVIDLSQMQCTVKEQPVALTSIELATLAELITHAGRPLTKSHLTEKILHRKLTAYDRSMDVHISRIRQKLKQAGISSDLIKTLRGQGYQCVL